MTRIRLGVDLDNTLICYDGLFHAAAVNTGRMPATGPRNKRGVRDWFCARDREDEFTFLQGYVYGPGLAMAQPYPDAKKGLLLLKKHGVPIYVVSHKTAFPFAGPQYDLRQAARDWLEANGFYAPGLLTPADVYFEDTMEDKIARISQLECTHFIDDMERFLLRPDFPDAVQRLWFAPDAEQGQGKATDCLRRFASWAELSSHLMEVVDAT